MLKVSLPVAVLVSLFKIAPAQAGDAWFAALSPDNEDRAPVTWGNTKDEAQSRALNACRRVSNSCGEKPAVTPSDTDVFVTVCCQSPELGCAVSPNIDERAAEDGARETLAEAGYSRCKPGRYLSAKTGEPTGYVEDAFDDGD